jgi:hypothetical protein
MTSLPANCEGSAETSAGVFVRTSSGVTRWSAAARLSHGAAAARASRSYQAAAWR